MTERSKAAKWLRRGNERGPRSRPVKGGRGPDQLCRAEIRVVTEQDKIMVGPPPGMTWDHVKKTRAIIPRWVPAGAIMTCAVATAAGVGGRRGRKRRRAEERNAPAGRWVLYLPSKAPSFDLYKAAREWAEQEMARALCGPP